MKEEIRAYLLEHRANPDVTRVEDGESLLDAGVIDSMSMVDLIAHLESAYGISVDEDDMIPENFDTLNAIVAYVEQKRA